MEGLTLLKGLAGIGSAFFSGGIMGAVSAGLTVLGNWIELARQNQLISAGEAKKALQLINKAQVEIDNANVAGDKAYNAPIDADGDGVADDDGARED